MTYVQFVIFSLVLLYAVFILLWLAIEDLILKVSGFEAVLEDIDLVFLVVFEIEIVLIYFSDTKNAFLSWF